MESLKGYWRRKDYKRLDGSNRFHKKNRVELGRTRRKQRFWRIKSIPRVRFFRVSSPKKLLARLRDAYVRMMLGFASSAGSISYGGGGRTTGFDRPALKEYDEKVIVEIYKSFMAHHQQLMDGRDGATKMGEIVCRRFFLFSDEEMVMLSIGRRRKHRVVNGSVPFWFYVGPGVETVKEEVDLDPEPFRN